MANAIESPLKDIIADLLGDIAELGEQVSPSSELLQENRADFSVGITLRYPWSEYPDIDLGWRSISIEGGNGLDGYVHGNPLRELEVEGVLNAYFQIRNNIDNVEAFGLANVGFDFRGKVGYAGIEGQDVYARFSQQVEVDVYGSGTFVLSNDRDEFYGDGGDQRVFGNDGDDTVYGGDGDDTVYGGDGDDYVRAGDGDDGVEGGDGDDYVRAGDGDDIVLGGNGDDVILGGDGNDALNGQAGRDYVSAGNGDDALIGSGNDTLDGGAGADQFVFTFEEGGNGAVSTGRDEDFDLLIINDIGVKANLHLDLGAGDQAVGFLKDGPVVDIDMLLAASGGNSLQIGNTTFEFDDGLGGKG